MANKKFDWHSEEDVGWEEEKVAAAPTAVSRPRRWWPALLLVVTILGFGGWIIARQVNARIAETTAQVEADVRAAHDLVLDAAARRDSELLRSTLSGRSPEWYAMQEELAAAGALFSRPVLGLTALPLPADEPPQIVLDPDFRQAEVSFVQAYAVQRANGITETVTLRQTAVYRRGAQRWLLAAPEADFWGEWQAHFGKNLSLRYPQRDEPWANRLAADLDLLIDRTCATLVDLACPDGLQVRLRLDDNADALRAFMDATYSWQTDELYLRLPPLTLLGMPQDEAGYQAVYRAYGAQVATAVISHLVAYDCCAHAPLYQVLLEQELHQLGLKPWDITRDDHLRVFTEQQTMDPLSQHWQDRDLAYLATDDGRLLYAAVDFLLNTTLTHPLDATTSSITPVWLQRNIERRQSFITWLTITFAGWEPELGRGSGLLHNLEARWWQYAYAQTLLRQETPPFAYPEQALLLSCEVTLDDTSATEAISLQQYDPHAAAWGEAEQLAGFGFVTLLPDDETVVRNIWQVGAETWAMSLWRGGQQIAAVSTEAALTFSFGQVDPTGQQLIVITMASEEYDPTFNLLDLAACTTSSACELTPLSGFPYWSPDGAQMIIPESLGADVRFFMEMVPINGRYVLFDTPDYLIAQELDLADAAGQPQLSLGAGYAPFWLDGETYGFMRLQGDGQEIVVGMVGDGRLQPILSLDDLLPYLPQWSGQLPQYRLGYAFAEPQVPHKLFVTVFDTAAQVMYVLAVDYTVGDTAANGITLLVQAGYNNGGSVSLSPDGRWLLLTGFVQNNPANPYVTTMYLYELATGKTQTFTMGDVYTFVGSSEYDWSADGKWLAVLLGTEGFVLSAPGEDYVQFVPYNAGLCAAVSWMNRSQ